MPEVLTSIPVSNSTTHSNRGIGDGSGEKGGSREGYTNEYIDYIPIETRATSPPLR